MPLADPIIKLTSDPILQMVCSVNQRNNVVVKLDTGMYQIGHWNPEFVTPNKLSSGWETDLHLIGKNGDYFGNGGGCDYPGQVLECIDLSRYSEQLVIFYVQINRKDQPQDGGWRFHKWGDYIGKHTIEYEYLYDQKDIDMVFTYHIYQFESL